MSKPTDILSDDQRADLLDQLTEATPDAGRVIREALAGEIPVKPEKLVDIAGDLLDRVGVPKMKYQTVEHKSADLSEDAAKYLMGAMAAIAKMMGLNHEAATIQDVTNSIPSDSASLPDTSDASLPSTPISSTSNTSPDLAPAPDPDESFDPDFLRKLHRHE